MISHHRWSRSDLRTVPLARELVRSGHSITLLVIADHSKTAFDITEVDGIRVVHCPDLTVGKLRSGWDPVSIFRRNNWLKQNLEEFDLVHAFETRPATIHPALKVARKLNIPLFIDWIDWWGRGGLITVNRPGWYQLLCGWYETYYEEAFRPYAQGSTVISRGLADRAVTLGVPRESILHLRNGVDLNFFKPLELSEARKIIGIEWSRGLVGVSGADVVADMKIAVDAFKVAVDAGLDAKLLLMGHAAAMLREHVTALNLQTYVIDVGFVDRADYPVFVAACDLFVVPFPEKVYNLGRWPNRFGEYLATGRPVIFNPYGDLADFAGAEAPGIACGHSAEAMAAGMSQLIVNRELWETKCELAHGYAKSHLGWPTIAAALGRHYHSIKLQTNSLKL